MLSLRAEEASAGRVDEPPPYSLPLQPSACATLGLVVARRPAPLVVAVTVPQKLWPAHPNVDDYSPYTEAMTIYGHIRKHAGVCKKCQNPRNQKYKTTNDQTTNVAKRPHSKDPKGRSRKQREAPLAYDPCLEPGGRLDRRSCHLHHRRRLRYRALLGPHLTQRGTSGLF